MPTFSKPWRLAWPALLFCAHAAAQGLSFAQPPMDLQSVQLVVWPAAEGGNGHFYEAVATPQGINWADALSYATARGGYLATISSPQENHFVFKLIDSAQFWLNSPTGDSWGPWLGGVNFPTPNAGGATWQWLNNEGALTYANWTPKHDAADNRPNNRLIFFGPGPNNRQPTWNQTTADQRLPGFVVEYDSNPLPGTLPYVALLGVCIVGLIALGSVIYFIVRWQRGRRASRLDR